jgi:ubiquinone biosynthesis protein
VSQVHVARFADGSEVALRVRRPGIDAVFARDRRRQSTIAQIAGTASWPEPPPNDGTLEDIGEWLQEDLDFARELRNLSALHAVADPTASFACQPGTSLCALLQLMRANQRPTLSALAIEPAQLGDALLRAVFDQIFRLELFQPDVHPANLMALADNRLGYVSVSQVRRIDPDFRKGLQRHLAAIIAGDSRPVLESLTEVAIAGEQSSAAQLRIEFDREMNHRERAAGAPPQSETARYLLAGLRAARRSGYRMPSGVAAVWRTLVVAERVAAELGSRATLPSVGESFLTGVQVRALLDILSPSQLRPAILEAVTLASEGPRGVRRLLSDFVDGRLVLRVRTSDSPEDAALANTRARLITMAIASVGLAFLVSATRGQMLFGIVPVAWALWAALAVIWIRLLIGLRELR